MYKKLLVLANKLLKEGWTAPKLALSSAVGLYIAFSPFPFAHTIIMVAAKHFLKLNFPVLFITTSINNPWTMIPFFSFDYAFGYWLIHTVLELDPGWTISLSNIFGSGSICLWSFLLGGNLLGIIAGVLGYPCMLYIFKKLVHTQELSQRS